MNYARYRSAGVGLLLLLPTMLPAAESAPPRSGLAAEMEGNWDRAIDIYTRTAQSEPGRADLWVRVADIQARLGRKTEAEAALRKAVEAAPDNADYWFRLSQARAVLDQPRPALDACRHALQLRPESLDILSTCARQASWAGDLETAGALYQRWLERQPGEADAQWGLARVDGWAGRLDASVKAYRRYLLHHGDNAEAWREYIQVEIWRGDYGAAKDALDEYGARFGSDVHEQRLRARLLARAEWPDAASAINEPLLTAAPRDYELNYTRTLALRAGNRPAEAIDSLDILRELRPDSPDTVDIMRFVHTPSRDFVRGSFSFYDDSDEITILRAGLDGRLVWDDKLTAVTVGLAHERLEADIGSGLETADGHETIHFEELWLGLERRFNPRVLGGAQIGVADVQREGQIGTYLLYLDLDPSDQWALRLYRRRSLYDLSPRSVSREVVQNGNFVEAHWRPDLNWFVDAEAGWSDFSDDNEKWQAVLAPRRAVVRHEHFNLDLGVSGEWFGFKHDLNNGYYDPEFFRRYALTAFTYWKIDDDNGVSAALSLGWHKDENMSSYKFGEDVVLEGFFGIYRDWYLRVRGGYAERDQSAGGGYDGVSFNLGLTRRF